MRTTSIVFCIAVLVGCGKTQRNEGSAPAMSGSPVPAAPAMVSAPIPTRVDIKALLGEYKDNEVRADSRFKGKFVEVRGTVGDIKKDLTGDTYVTIGTGEAFEIPVFQCSVAEGQNGAAAALSKGQKATVRGTITGLMMNVLGDDCVIEPALQVCEKLRPSIEGATCGSDDKGAAITARDVAGVIMCFADDASGSAAEKFSKLAKSENIAKQSTFIGSARTGCAGMFMKVQGKTSVPIDPAMVPKLKAFFDAL